DGVCSAFARSAATAAEAGFDLLELQFGHGYLIAGFISPLTNRRDDCYGGSLENRLRFPLRVLSAVREAWPDARPLAVAFSATDWKKGGLSGSDAIETARRLRDGGADVIHVVTGQTTFDANPAYGRAWEAPYGDAIRNDTGTRVMLGGNLTSADEVNTLLAAGRADLCIVSPLAPAGAL
ncbi:MAG TPA: bifunctional salicylyl-CoA 5-hydroxylase/oxidoreductase, partial [Chloroflexota bacterium]|nr:bifunctional salicylyl-CoA 5-hydroxylase/oxidoreductase [Chloroflexota bacterium]